MDRKKKTKLIIGLFSILVLTWGGIIYFGYRNPQTFMQYASSHIGNGKSVVNSTNQVIFLGDSITAREDWNVLFGVSNITNAGFSGNNTDDILARLNPVTKLKSQKLFLMIGINDLFIGRSTDYVMKNYEAILDRVKQESPDTVIYVQSVLPINNDIVKSNVDSQKILTLNSEIKRLAGEKGLLFIDLYPNFCGVDNKMRGKYARDGLHLNSYGYDVWKGLIVQYVK